MLHMNFGGNPIIQQLLEKPNTDIDRLLDIESFPAQFRNANPKLEKYMSQAQYQKLIQYVTVLGTPENKNQGFKYPLIAAEILSIENTLTQDALMSEKPVCVEIQEIEEKWVEKEVDECDSQYCSSEGSRKLDFEDMIDTQIQQQNIPPLNKKQRKSIETNNNLEIKEKRSNSSSSQKNSQASITSDDFPMADAEKKIIKVKEVYRKKVKKQYKPFLEQLFDYFNGEIHHTLAGYICKVLGSLLKKYPVKIIQYIFRSKIYKNMLKHAQSFSVCELFINLFLTSQPQSQSSRQQLLSMIIKLAINPAIDSISAKNYLYIFMETINKLDPLAEAQHQKLLDSIYRQQNLLLITENCFKASNKNFIKETSFQMMLVLLKKIQSPVVASSTNKITTPSQKTQQQEEKIENIKKILKNKTEICFKDYISKIWDLFGSMLNEQEVVIVPSSIVIRALEIVNCLLKDNLYWSRIQLCNQPSAFHVLCEICRKFPSNNMLHNQIFQIFKLAVHCTEQQPNLVKKIFQQKSVFSFFLEALHKKQILYRGQVITLAHLLKNSHSEIIKQLKSDSNFKWQRIEEALLTDLEKTNKNLGGHNIKKNIKPTIFFEKEEILEHFRYFLKGEIPEQIQIDVPEEEVEDLTSSRGSCEWSDWNDFSNCNTDQVDQQ